MAPEQSDAKWMDHLPPMPGGLCPTQFPWYWYGLKPREDGSMAASDHLSPSQFSYAHETMTDDETDVDRHYVIASHPSVQHSAHYDWGPHSVGALHWSADDKVVNYVDVHPDYRRQGIGTELWNRAKQIEPGLKHDLSEGGQTAEGRAWAQKAR